MKWKPYNGDRYFVSDIHVPEKYFSCIFNNSNASIKDIENNNCFQTKEEAIAATELCLSALRGELVRKEDVIKRIKDIYTNVREYQRVIDLVIESVEEL